MYVTTDPTPADLPAFETDEACVEAIAHGSEPALRMLYDRHSAVVYGLALRITGSDEQAAEATIAAFAQAWSGAARYRGLRGNVQGWLTTIARLRALELLRNSPRDSAATPIGDHSPVAAALPDDTQRVLSLVFFGGLNQQEAATQLGLPLETVRRHVESGMKALRHRRESE